MPRYSNLITNRSARLPGDYAKQLTSGNRGGRAPHQSGKMNKREALYSLELEARRRTGEIQAWMFESVKFRLADRTWYTPDFAVWHNDGRMECVEVKGHWEDDARVKWKVVAELYPSIIWTVVP